MEAYAGVEFLENSEIALVHSKWLTPTKRHTFWPPYKTSGPFNKSLTIAEEPDEPWKLYPIKRLLFYCDNLEKARKKLKKWEETSDIQSSESDFETLRVKRRLKAKRCLSDSTSEDEEPSKKLKRPPCFPNLRADSSCGSSDVYQEMTSTPTRLSSRKNLKSGEISTTTLENTLLTLPNRIILPNSDILKSSPSTSIIIREDNTSNANTESFCESNTTISVSSNALEKIYRQVKKLGEELKEVKGLLKQSRHPSSVPSLPNNLPVELPLNSQENLQILEHYLGEEEAFNNLALYLSTLGGNGMVSCVNKILRLLLSDILATAYNFAGQRSKQAFGTTKLNSLVIRAIQVTSPLTTKAEIENAVKTWLKHAKQRIDKKRKSY
ncbi:uncharacterized protein LOC126739611 [Anthonomus grandis grandis]|uniref:uncharacterized protein LOC126739611 n=1 Tax=Anthonomus grandis grandis TaxID=2921223 RepID=UPI002166560F|nr:uncharacterized protein LOC126739611 [Anthonomus grandis grandis]